MVCCIGEGKVTYMSHLTTTINVSGNEGCLAGWDRSRRCFNSIFIIPFPIRLVSFLLVGIGLTVNTFCL